MTYWTIFAWFMGGVILRQAYKILGFAAKPKDARGMTWGQCLALKGQGVIIGVVLAWVWVGGHFWAFVQTFEEHLPIVSKIPQVGVDQLSSVAVGFILEWVLAERLVAKWGRKPTGG